MNQAPLLVDAVDRSEPPRRWPAVLGIGAIVLAAYVLIAIIGHRQDVRDERVLGVLTPLFEWLRDSGMASQEFLHTHRRAAGLVGSAWLLAIGAAASRHAGRRAWPVWLLCAAFGLAGWGQVAVQGDATTVGVVLYLAAVAGAFALGIACPWRRLATFPPFPPGAAAHPAAESAPRRAATRWRLPWRWECAVVLGLMLTALVLRTWAITELYNFFDLEMIDSMIQGRTLHGYLGYLDFGFVQNNGGAIHLLPTQLTFRLFGTSIFTLRMTSALWSVAAVPLMYTLARRLGGVTAAVCASVFLITAPEQLFWARNENAFFAPTAVCALLTAHLALWMVQRFSPWAVLLNALWMPWCRWFYSACMVAFLIPIVTALHAMLCARGLWRKVWYVVPLLAVGLAGWIFSLSVMKTELHGGQWTFINPAAVYGASAWRKQGEFADASFPDLIRLQAVSMSRNFAEVVRNMTYHTENFSHWCQRSQPADHRTILNVGLSLIVFVGLGYLLAQFYDRRAFLLLACWGISVLPAILSQEPADRRMAMFFPYSHLLGGVVLAAFLHLIADRGGRYAESLASGLTAVGLAVIGLTNLSSHLLMPTQPVLFGDYPRFTKPLLEESDAIYTNLPEPFRALSVFGNLDHFLQSPTCLQYVEPTQWLSTALNPKCAFDDQIYSISIGSGAVLNRLRAAYNPKRVSYLLTEDPSSAPQIALLQALHPDTPFERHPVPRAERTLVRMTVDIDQIARLRAPTLGGNAAGAATKLLGDVPLQRAPDLEANGAPGATVEGGILIEAEGWYRWRLEPECANAGLTLDGEAAAADIPRPMLAGVHPFTLTVPDPSACAQPLRIVMESIAPQRSAPVAREHFVAKAVAALPEVRAQALGTFAGYGKPVPFLQLRGRPIDFGVDGKGNVAVLLREGNTFRVRRYDPTGKEIAAWEVEMPPTITPGTIGVAADGTTAVLVLRAVHLYDPQGKEIATWEHPWFVWETALSFWGDLLIGNIHHRDAMVAFTRTGELVTEFKTFPGGPGKLYAPMSYALDSEGNLLVEQLDGQALRFRLTGPEFTPAFVESFRTDQDLPGTGFDGTDRVLVVGDHGLRAYGTGGRRLMAMEPQRDPTRMELSGPLRVHRAGDKLMVLNTERGTLWTIPG